MKSLIVGMGIGELYKSVLTQLDFDVVTVDPVKNADFKNIVDALEVHQHFDTVNICTPNFTHEALTSVLAPHSDIIFVEKPGFKNSTEWEFVHNQFPNTRIMMVKNNMWRDNISEMQMLAADSIQIDIKWIRKNCIPNPGSWFTNKELAYGGVSRDLVPHLLSLYIAMNPLWEDTSADVSNSQQNWELSKIESTEYGVVDYNGTYNVDDYSHLRYENKWHIQANWRDLTKEESCVTFTKHNELSKTIDLGWCPEDAYLNMIKTAVANKDNDIFWKDQFKQDFWIHKQIETL